MAAVAELKPTVPHFADSVLELPLNLLVPAEDNPRRDVGDLSELAASIKSMGLIEPIVATPRDPAAGTYTIVAGHRRYAAAIVAELEYVPVYVKELTDGERIATMLVENLQRTDLQPLEEAGAYRRLVDEFGMTQRQLSEKVGRSQGHISKRLTLLRLPKKVLKALDSGGITLDDARALTQLVNMPERINEALKRGKEWGSVERAVSVQLREHEAEVRSLQAAGKLAEKGVRVIRRGSYGAPTGTIRVGGFEFDQLDVTEAAHKKLDCHAAYISDNGEAIYVCTKPKSHGKKRREPSDRAKKFRAHEKAMREARTGRRAFATLFIAGKVPTAHDLIFKALLRRAEAEATKIACALLELEPVIEKSRYGEVKRFDKAIAAYAAKSAANVTRAGLALALATDEMHARPSWSRWSDHTKAYVKLLQDNGYKVTPAEKLELAGKAPTPTGTY